MFGKLEEINPKIRKTPMEVAEAIPQVFKAYKNAMIAAAISAEKRAQYWNKEKPVHIGCSLLVLGEKLDLSQPAIYTGANIKLSPEILAYPERKCGEMIAFENALELKEDKDKTEEERAEENTGDGIEKGDVGLILALLTVSRAFNSGEADTVNHDIMYPCKQCMTSLKYMLKKGIISNKSIIYNARIGQKGELIRTEQITFKDLLEKFKSGEEERNLKTIQDLLSERDKAAQLLFKSVEKINYDINEDIKSIAPLTRKDVLTGFQRERNEKVFEEERAYTVLIKNALKSGIEEGVSKERLVDSLGLADIVLDTTIGRFRDDELDSIVEKLLQPLIENLPQLIIP